MIPERYAQALGDDDPIEVLAETPDRLRKLVRGLTEAQLSRKPAPGKWSMKEIVAHLADGEVIVGSRYRFIAAHEKPPLPGYDQDAFVERLGPLNAKAVDLVDDFAMARAVNLGLLDRLPSDALDRVGLHAERGEESIRKMIAMCAGHDRVHLQQMETIRVGLFPPRRVRKPVARTKASGKSAPKKKAIPAKRRRG